MNKESYYLKGEKHQDLYVRRYAGDGPVKAVIQILHGMAEYGGRYEQFCHFLTEEGYTVYVHDHRKHGKSIGQEQKIGYYTRDTWQELVEDINRVQEDILLRESRDKLIMIGHSMGSFLLRNYLIDYGDHVDKAVIMGTADTHVPLARAGILVAKLLAGIAGHKPSPFLNFLSVGSYNKAFQPAKTKVDWLSRDEALCRWYEASPLCGFNYTPKFYEELAKGLLYIIPEEHIKKTPVIPLLFLSGEKDPVGDMGKGVRKVHGIYQSLGYDGELVLYREARHELLNEINKEEVYQQILEFLER